MKSRFLNNKHSVMGTGIFLAAMLLLMVSACAKKKEVSWVMPSTATPTEAAEETPLTEETAKELLQDDFPEAEITFVSEVRAEETACFRFLLFSERAEGETAYQWVNDYYDISESSGKIVSRQVTDEKAEAILKEAFDGVYDSFENTGETVNIADLEHMVYTVPGLDQNIYISITGNQVLLGNYRDDTGEWDVEVIVGN